MYTYARSASALLPHRSRYSPPTPEREYGCTMLLALASPPRLPAMVLHFNWR